MAYNTTNITTSTSHIYTDVTFPSGQSSYLSFRYNVNGETTSGSLYDVLYVYLCPQTLTPAVGSPSGSSSAPTWTGTGTATLLGSYNLLAAGSGGYANIAISTAIAGNASVATNMRLVFTWKNDNSGGAEPPAAIDNIFLASSAAMSGTYTINNTLPTIGANFANFTAAIQALNARGISGAVTFNVTAGQTFTEDPVALSATGTISNTIVFQKSGIGANPVIKPTGGAGTADFGIAILGGDYITFDGIDITENTGSAIEYGYYIGNASTTNGAQNNTIRNTTITLNKANTSSYGIIQMPLLFLPLQAMQITPIDIII